MIHFERYKLANGMRVILAPMKETKAVTVLALVGTGSRYETKSQNGISHFLEHLFFKGTKRRPTYLHIARELDSIGASFNAFTSEEYTGFYVRSAKDKFGVGLDIISDILLNSQFPEAEIAKEKQVIIEEINMYEDIPQKQIIDITKEVFYPNSSLGRPVLGNKKSVTNLNRNDFVNYLASNYTAKNSIIVIAGGGNKEEWLEAIKSKFALLSNKQEPKFRLILKTDQKNPKIKIKYKKTDQAHLTLGVRTFSRKDKRRYPLAVFNNILGATMSSRLFSEVRERRGLAYYVGSDTMEFYDTGGYLAFAGVQITRLEEAIKVIYGEILKTAKFVLGGEELERAKNNIEGKMYIGLEDSFSVAEFFAEQELLFGEILQPEEILAEIKKVDEAQILRLARNLFKTEYFNLTIIGPFKGEGKFRGLLK